MRDKTDFQKKCCEKFLSRLKEKEISFDKWDFVEGNEESYYQGDIGLVSVWIYEDGACIKKEKKSELFEDLDYQNEDELIKYFMNKGIKGSTPFNLQTSISKNKKTDVKKTVPEN